MQRTPSFHAETPLFTSGGPAYASRHSARNILVSDDRRRLSYVTFLIAVSGLIATARAMSVAAVTSPYPRVVRVANEKYCRSGMLGCEQPPHLPDG